jgi:hypothetical protein
MSLEERRLESLDCIQVAHDNIMADYFQHSKHILIPIKDDTEIHEMPTAIFYSLLYYLNILFYSVYQKAVSFHCTSR